ncbi:TonB family protein [Bacteroides gallinarum]
MSDKAQSCPKCGAPNPNASMRIPMGFSFNPCAWHSDAPAVSSCVTCGKAMCKKCVDSAPFTLDNKPQCNECSLQMLAENIAANKKTKVWSIVKLIFLLFFMSIGLMMYLSNPNDIMNAWIYAGLGGLPSALKTFVTRSAEEKWADEAMSRVNPSEGCFQQMVAFIIKIIFAFVFAPVAAIWFTIKNSIAIAKSSRAIKADQEDYDTIQSRMQEMEHPNEELATYIGQEPQMASQTSAYAPVLPEIPVQQVSPDQISTDVIHAQPAHTSQTPPVTSSYQTPTSPKRNNALVIGIAIGALALVGLIAGYFICYVPYAKDRDALRTYVVANNVFLRSSKVAGVEYNVLSKVPYGSELITYSKDSEWAEIKVNGVEGFVASPYLLEWNDFKLLNDVWGSADTKEYIESSKCRLAILDYCKRNLFTTGNDGWQLYTLQKNVKPNNVLYPRLNNGYDKFTEFAFILKNNATQERRFALYSFDEETEKPIFLYEESAPAEGEIKNVRYINRKNQYYVTYTGGNIISATKETSVRSKVKELAPPPPEQEISTIKYVPPVITTEEVKVDKKENIADNTIYETVEQMPEFPNGGTTGLMNFIGKNLRYPTYCKEEGIQGRVIVVFVVNKDGSTSDFKVVWSANKHLDKEALRVLSGMPKWKPGKQNGVPVRVKCTIPINFKLS